MLELLKPIAGFLGVLSPAATDPFLFAHASLQGFQIIQLV
jgi:hypothetical protein